VAISTLSTPAVAIARAGVVEYEKALDIQRTFHDEVARGLRPNTLLLLEHPSIYTAGKRTRESEKPTNGARVIDVDRGGKITWHGPGQLVGYPIIKLANPQEVVGFVRALEGALIKVCGDFGVTGVRIEDRSGVWIDDARGQRKIAAIGIRVAQGVSMHGFALNVNPDLSPFKSIVPCGISDADVTSLEVELARPITIDHVLSSIEQHMYEALVQVAQ